MKIYVLIVEDDINFIEEICNIIDGLPGEFEFKIAHSRNEAFTQLDAGFFLDFVILDLSIPTISGALDATPKHGHAVFNKIRAVAPGTPIFVLTGSPAEDFIPDLLENQQQIDIWGEGKRTGNIQFLNKYYMNECPEKLESIANAIERLSDVEMDRNGVDLNIAEDRLIRIFAKRFNGVHCKVRSLGGGLSSARVIRLLVTDDRGVHLINAVAKLAELREVHKEGENYENYIARLQATVSPRKLATLEFGAYTLAGIFFSLEDGFDESAIDVVKDAPERIIPMIRNIQAATTPWVDGVPQTRNTIKQFRQKLLGDELFAEIQRSFGLDWAPRFEDRAIQARWACVHGDLHSCNILVSANGAIVLIDYGDVGEGPASLDPVTLELSLLFHPGATSAAGAWPSINQAKAWGDLDAYLIGCPFPKFVCECRRWALCVAAGKREVAASAYSYLIRQLKYKNTNKALAVALLDGIKSFYDEST